MLNYPHYYRGCTKNIIAMFGVIFGNIHIKRATGDGNEFQEIKVPLSYAPKQRAYIRTTQQPDIDSRPVQVVLPRMSYEIVALNYDGSRRLNTNSNFTVYGQNSRATSMHSATPYNINVNLYIYTKNQDDALQIVEQIFPFFNPDFNITINSIPDMGIKEDIPVILDSVSYEDDYEGDLETRRAIIWTLGFTVCMNYYGPMSSNGVIKRVTINMSDIENENPDEFIFQYRAVVDPITANENDPHTIVESFLYGGE